MLVPTRLVLIPKSSSLGWRAERLTNKSVTSASWMGGLTRDGRLVHTPCVLSPMTLQSITESALHEQAHSFTQGEWSRRCQRAQELLAGACRKVVLARSTRFQIIQGAWQDLLCSMAQDGCSSLWIEQPDGGGWMATTPETLFRRLGSHLQTEALAGTLRAEGSDEELFARLRACDRRRAEVDLTAEGILEALSSLGARHIVKAPLQMRRFRDWAHLCIPIAADVTGISDESLLEALHPSPAVCGTPRHVSGVCRRGIEGNTSGWYAGACGISTPEWALFVVVLRCAEIRGSMAEAWAGVGLVPGFCAEQEWRELELKLASWRRLCQSA